MISITQSRLAISNHTNKLVVVISSEITHILNKNFDPYSLDDYNDKNSELNTYWNLFNKNFSSYILTTNQILNHTTNMYSDLSSKHKL